jgi:hypothetical protein
MIFLKAFKLSERFGIRTQIPALRDVPKRSLPSRLRLSITKRSCADIALLPFAYGEIVRMPASPLPFVSGASLYGFDR